MGKPPSPHWTIKGAQRQQQEVGRVASYLSLQLCWRPVSIFMWGTQQVSFCVCMLQRAGTWWFFLLVILFFPWSTGLHVTSLRRRGVISSMFSSKSSAPCFQATLAKWTKLPCWKKSSAFCRNTTVRFTAALHVLARQLLQCPVSFSDYQNGSRGLKVPT